jgi:hypothetical protein
VARWIGWLGAETTLAFSMAIVRVTTGVVVWATLAMGKVASRMAASASTPQAWRRKENGQLI